jgi:hypothetical protein
MGVSSHKTVTIPVALRNFKLVNWGFFLRAFGLGA